MGVDMPIPQAKEKNGGWHGYSTGQGMVDACFMPVMMWMKITSASKLMCKWVFPLIGYKNSFKLSKWVLTKASEWKPATIPAFKVQTPFVIICSHFVINL